MASNETPYERRLMFIKKTPADPSGLEKAIETVLFEMQGYSANDDEYAKMTDQLKKLYKLKAIDTPERVSYDTMAIIVGNLVGIVLIVGHERTHVIASRALTFLLKLR
jgi:hypothetical protein